MKDHGRTAKGVVNSRTPYIQRNMGSSYWRSGAVRGGALKRDFWRYPKIFLHRKFSDLRYYSCQTFATVFLGAASSDVVKYCSVFQQNQQPYAHRLHKMNRIIDPLIDRAVSEMFELGLL